MRQAMYDAEVGDDVWGDDPTVNTLQEMAAERLGKERALLMPSGTQSNLTALFAHCQRGDEYLVGEAAHMYRYEAGGGAVLASVQPQTLAMGPNGELSTSDIEKAIKPDDPHFPRSRLICIENTHDGKVLSLDYQNQIAELAANHQLKLHLDGARAANAAVALGVTLQTLTQPFDSVSLCLSKGLGAPIGSVLAGSEEVVEAAIRARKILGGAMRQSGILAAAGIYALENNVERLEQDHERAARLAIGLTELGLDVEHNTNMVFTTFGSRSTVVAEALTANGILLSVSPTGPTRMVTHLDIDDAAIDATLKVIGQTLGPSR